MRTKTLSLLRAVWALNCCISLESIAPGLGSQRVPFNACWLGGSGSSKPGTKDLISMSPPLEWQLPAMSWSREAAASLPRWTAFREPLVTGLLSSGPLLLWRYLYRNLLPKHVRHSLPPLLPKVWATSRLEAFHHRCGFQTSPVHILGHQGLLPPRPMPSFHLQQLGPGAPQSVCKVDPSHAPKWLCWAWWTNKNRWDAASPRAKLYTSMAGSPSTTLIPKPSSMLPDWECWYGAVLQLPELEPKCLQQLQTLCQRTG